MRHIHHSILLLICLTVLFTSFVGAQSKSKGNKTKSKMQVKVSGKKSEKYPNELPNFRFYETAKWKSLEPLVSTMADVRRILGEPSEANDVSQYTKPYPGDDKAKQPVFIYELNSDWQILVYFVKYCFQGYVPLSDELDNKLCSIDLIPKNRVPFQSVVFSDVFKKKDVRAVDGAWTEYSDGTGLFYEVYAVPGPYGKEKKGDLNRIVYTASNKTFENYSTNKQ